MIRPTLRTPRTGRLIAASALMITTAMVHPALAQQTVLLVGGGGGGAGAGTLFTAGAGGGGAITGGGGGNHSNFGAGTPATKNETPVGGGSGGIGGGSGGWRGIQPNTVKPPYHPGTPGDGLSGAASDAANGYSLANTGSGGCSGNNTACPSNNLGAGGVGGANGGGAGGDGYEISSSSPSSSSTSYASGGGGGAGSAGVISPNYSSASNGINGGNGGDAVDTVNDSETYSIIAVGGGGGGGSSARTASDVGAIGGNGGNGGNGILVINGAMAATNYITLGGQGGGAGIMYSAFYPPTQQPYNPANGGTGGNGGNGTITLNGTLTASNITLGNSAGASTPSANGGNGGNGALNIMNNGRLILTGSNATVQTGQQAFASSGLICGTGAVNLSGAAHIEVDTGNTATISAQVDDLGSGPAGILTKDGGGALILQTAGSYTGGTTINGGVLQMGTSSSPLSNYNEAANGPLTVLVTPSGAANSAANTATPGDGSIQVMGKATLGGPVVLNMAQPAAGQTYSIGTTYNIITTTNGVTGTFSNVSLTGPYAAFLQADPDYSAPNSVSMKLAPSPNMYRSGYFYASNAYAQNSALFDVLAAPSTSDSGYWLHGLGGFGHMVDANYNYKGAVIGHGMALGQHLTVGGGVSNIYTHTEGLNGSYVNGTNVGGLLYAAYTLPKWRVDSSITAGHLGDKSTRNMPGIGSGTFSNSGYYTGVAMQARYNWVNQTHWFAAPDAGISYLHTYMGHGQESGVGGLDMRYAEARSNLAQTSFGLTGGYKTTMRPGILSAWTRLGGIGTLGNPHIRIGETVGGQSAGVTGEAAPAAAFTPSVGLELSGYTLPWKLAAGWSGQFTKRAEAQNFTLKGSFKF